MKSNNHPMTVIHLANIGGAFGICIALAVAFYYQIVKHELPCPLCLLQRIGLIISGFGFLFNACVGVRNLHYGMVIMGSVLTGIMASRQVFLHIMPGDTGYGSALIGLHFYTWALISSVVIIAFTAVVLAISEMKFAAEPLTPSPVLVHFTGWVFLLLVLANLVSTILECGYGQCADNPTIYELLSK